jgi:hypothetical protein
MNHEKYGGSHRLARCMKVKALLDSGITDRKSLAREAGVSVRQIHRDMHVLAEADGGSASLVQRRRNQKKT